MDFVTFKATEAIELLRQDILAEIKRSNRGCSPEKLDFYISENFLRDYAQAVLLIAECLADYYRTRELAVIEYLGGNYNPLDNHIKELVVTKADLGFLLDELRKAQNQKYEMYQS